MRVGVQLKDWTRSQRFVQMQFADQLGVLDVAGSGDASLDGDR